MKPLKRFFSRLSHSVTRRETADPDVRIREEIAEHIALQTSDNLRAGLSPAEARRQALLKFGGIESMKQDYRSERGLVFLDNLLQDIRFAFRSLRRTPGLTAFVALTLALGIGITAGTFSMVDALIFRPYPVPHPGNVVTLVSTTHDDQFGGFSYREYLDIRDKTASYGGVIAYADMGPVGFSSGPNATPRVRGGMLVSGNYFRVLQVEPTLGRSFRPEEDNGPGSNPVVVLGRDFWKHEFGSDPSVLGRVVRLNGTDFTVIGVAPEIFPGLLLFGHPDFYMPLSTASFFSIDQRKNFFADRDDRELLVKARLEPGVTIQQAQNELVVLARNFETEFPKTNHARGAAVHTQFEMRTQADDANWKFGVIFNILALAVLLVACTNVAGLLLSRARARTREIAVRLAIGASRLRLVRLLLTESLVLSVFGGLVGIAIGYGVVIWFQSQAPIVFLTDLPNAIPFQMDTRVLIACVGLAVLSALACGVVPAFQSTRTDLLSGLKSTEVEAPSHKRLWGRNLLVVMQVAASLMLLTAAFLMVRGFERSMTEGTGFAKDHLLMTSFDPRLERYTPTQTQQFYKLLTERLRQSPGVESATLTQNVPLGADGFEDFETFSFVPEGFQMPRDQETFSTAMDTVDDSYFDTMRIPILHGRAFRQSDTTDSTRVAIVNEHFANHYFPNADALGKRLRLDSRDGVPIEIVGIAPTIKYLNSFEKPIDFVYLPLAQHPTAQLILLSRSSADEPVQLIPAVKDVVRALDPNMPMMQTRTYEDYYINKAIKGPGIASKLVAAMGVVGLFLAIAGLYGLIAYNVSRRTREIGIRMALGASASNVLLLVMSKGLLLVGIGTILGLVMGFGVERLMDAMLFNAGGVDFAAYAMVVPLLLAITLLAAYLPARRASHIHPTQALRYE